MKRKVSGSVPRLGSLSLSKTPTSRHFLICQMKRRDIQPLGVGLTNSSPEPEL